MRFIFKFPDIGEGISEGKILEWYVKKGQNIESGTSLVKMETDKVVADIPSPRQGIVVNCFGKIGDVIHVEDPLVELEIGTISPQEAQSLAHEKPAGKTQEPLGEKGFGVVGTLEVAGDGAYLPASNEATPIDSESQPSSKPPKALATPVARAMAKELGVNLNEVTGTGPGGRVMKKDIQAYFQSPQTEIAETPLQKAQPIQQHQMAHRLVIPNKPNIPPPQSQQPEFTTTTSSGMKLIDLSSMSEMETRRVEIEDAQKIIGRLHSAAAAKESRIPASKIETVPLTQIRKAIAKRMALSKQNIPHVTVFEEVEVSKLVELRKNQKLRFAEDHGISLTYIPFVIKALIIALKKHPVINSQLDMEHGAIVYKYMYNIGIAVDTPDGLMVPVIRNADQKNIPELAKEINDLASRARNRELELEEMKHGTFSITNYGGIAGLHSVPIINYPEVGILGIGRVREQPIVQQGKVVPGNVMPLSLSVDHRAVDGGEASKFLQIIVLQLQDPVGLCLS